LSEFTWNFVALSKTPCLIDLFIYFLFISRQCATTEFYWLSVIAGINNERRQLSLLNTVISYRT